MYSSFLINSQIIIQLLLLFRKTFELLLYAEGEGSIFRPRANTDVN